MDRVDRQLLGLLQENNLKTSDELASVVGRSSSVVARRLRRIRNEGLIVAEGAQLSVEAAGNPMSAVVQIQLKRHSRQEIEPFIQRLAASPSVQSCFEVSGTFDILLLVVADDMASFDALADEMIAQQPAVLRYETAFVKKRVKATLAFPIKVDS